MKLSLVEPFGVRPSAEERGELEAKEITARKIISPKVDDAPTGESMRDSDDSELRRGFERFIDFLAKQRKQAPKEKMGHFFCLKVIRHYKQVMSNKSSLELKGRHYNESA